MFYLHTLYYIFIILITLYKLKTSNTNKTKIIFNYIILPWIIFSAMGHLLFTKQVAKSIGWTVSPFQYELGFFTLALFILGFYVDYKNYSIQTYNVIIYIWLIFTFLCTLLHFKEIILKKNYKYNNIYPIFITYIMIIIVLYMK